MTGHAVDWLAELAEPFPTHATVPGTPLPGPESTHWTKSTASTRCAGSRDDKKVMIFGRDRGEGNQKMLTKVITIPLFTVKNRGQTNNKQNWRSENDLWKKLERIGRGKSSFRMVGRVLSVLANCMLKGFWGGKRDCFKDGCGDLTKNGQQNQEMQGGSQPCLLRTGKTMTVDMERRKTKNDVCMCPVKDGREAKTAPKRAKRART